LFNFKIQNNAEQRRQESNKIRSKFPDKIAIICEKDPESNLSSIDKNKFLVSQDFTVFQFIEEIKKKYNCPGIDELFLLANGRDLLNNDSSLSEVYNKYKDPEDDLLYIAYTNQIPPSKYPKGQVPSKSYSSKDSEQAFLFKFKADYINAEERRKECNKIRNQFPEKIPIICEKDPKSKLKDLDKSKYLVPGDLTVSQFSLMIRKRLQLPYESEFFLLANGKNAIGDIPLSNVYEMFRDPEDGFLYIAYSSEL